MFVPEPPALGCLEHITPSIYEAGVGCLAKAAWYAFGERGMLPENPAAILGMCFHAVVAAGHRGELWAADSYDRAAARRLFDKTAQALHVEAHPLVRLKFPAAEQFPYYNLHRERAVLLADRIASSHRTLGRESAGSSKALPPFVRSESRLCSRNGLIVGRADHLDGKSGTVVDYKSGYFGEDKNDPVSDSEARQLRLYAHLASENGIAVSKGAIVRGDGSRCELFISSTDADREAKNAEGQLQTLNAAASAGAEFTELASPSPQNCRFCPCKPFCSSFWASAKAEWESECGSHVEGIIQEAETRQIQDVSVTTLLLTVRCGTVGSERVFVEQVPSDWMMLGENVGLPRLGDDVRLVHGRRLQTDGSTLVLRCDKATTAVWRLRPGGEISGE